MEGGSGLDSGCSCTGDLVVELESLKAENSRLRLVNQALQVEVEELKERIRFDDTSSASRLESSPPGDDLPDMRTLLAALTDASVSISYSNSELEYVWATHFLQGFKFMHGKHDEEVFPPETKGLEDFMLLKRQALDSRRLQIDYVEMDMPVHGNMTWLVMVKPYLGCDGVPVGVLTTCLNISLATSHHSRSRTTDELREAVRLTEEAIRAKNMFLSIMSHEIRTPLNGLLGMAEALESSGLNKDQRELLMAIVSSGTIIIDILGDILDLASMESGAMQLEAKPFNPASVVSEVVKMAVAATHEKGLEILAQVGESVPELLVGDGLRVRQVMKYLVLNAIKFTQRGHVKIRLDSIFMVEEPTSVECSSHHKDQFVKTGRSETNFVLWCQIADTGVGIPKEAFSNLFDHLRGTRFSTTVNHGGTGLGIALCKQLVELMGGRLTVESEVGVGSVFTFTVLCKTYDSVPKPEALPKVPVKVSTGQRPELKTSPAWKPRILLAEDNKVNVMVAISMLKRLGFTAQVVANGVEALEAMRKEKYDLVLLDICMPLMDGLQVAYAIRKYEETGSWPEGLWDDMDSHKKKTAQADLSSALQGLRTDTKAGGRIPIIAVTANALRSDVERCFAHGMDAFIPKPVMFQKLREILSKYLPVPGC